MRVDNNKLYLIKQNNELKKENKVLKDKVQTLSESIDMITLATLDTEK